MMTKKTLSCVLLFCCIKTLVLCYNDTTLQTKLGLIKGVAVNVQNETVYQFRKIPFAKAPVGRLRFQKPQIFPQWNGTLDATKYGPSCMQNKNTLPSHLPNMNVSEDCLFLNIYVPRNVSKLSKRSVIIWVHGGAYVVGQAMYYDGSYLALAGDVIVVTINYRLGVFGFLSFGRSPALGNYGLWDQKMAFNWVHENIDSFGGNPASVTIFGESAGGFSVGLQAFFPGNKGIFQRVIQDSGVGNSFVAYSRNYLPLANAVGMSINCGNLTSVEPLTYFQCLQNSSANALQNASDIITYTFTSNVDIALPIGPVIDGEFLKDDPVNLLKDISSNTSKFFRSLDVLAGTMNAEGSLLLTFTKGYQTIFHFNLTQGIPRAFMCNQMAHSLAQSFYNSNPYIVNAICDKYKLANGDGVNLAQQSRRVVDFYGDVYFVSPAVQNLNFHSSRNTQKSSYLFLFSAGSPFPHPSIPSWFSGAPHSSELPYLFGLQALPSVPLGYLQLSNAMLKYWTNFAKTGNPNGNSLPHWPQYNQSEKSYLHLDTNITQEKNLYSDRVNFWLEEIPEILKTNSTGITSTTSRSQEQSSTGSQLSSNTPASSTTDNSTGNKPKLSFMVIVIACCSLYLII